MQPDNIHADQGVVEAAFRESAAPLYRYIYSKVGQAAPAEDLTSQVFLKALRWLEQDRAPESVRGWLYATARTVIVDHWRRQGSQVVLPLDFAEEMVTGGPEQDDDMTAQAARARLRRVLCRLPPRERQVLTLRYLRGYTAAEIGQELSLSTAYVRVVQFRALRQAALLEAAERGIVNLRPRRELEHAKVGNDWPTPPHFWHVRPYFNAENKPKVGKGRKRIFYESLS